MAGKDQKQLNEADVCKRLSAPSSLRYLSFARTFILTCSQEQRGEGLGIPVCVCSGSALHPLKLLWGWNHFTAVPMLPWLYLGCVEGLGCALTQWSRLLLAMPQACGAIAEEVPSALSSTFPIKSLLSWFLTMNIQVTKLMLQSWC